MLCTDDELLVEIPTRLPSLQNLFLEQRYAGLEFGTDEDIESGDVYTAVFDMTDEPVKYLKERLEMVRRLRTSVQQSPGTFNSFTAEHWYRFEKDLINDVYRCAADLLRLLGGKLVLDSLTLNHSHVQGKSTRRKGASVLNRYL